MVLFARSYVFAVAVALAGCTQAPLVAARPCPAWVDYPADSHSNGSSPYLGCTNRANLERMLEDKRDLVAGRRLGPARGERESLAVKAYDEGKTKTSNTGGATQGGAILLQQSGGGTQQ
jgi:type IV pilus biogenesis protein CpaD/CtpE